MPLFVCAYAECRYAVCGYAECSCAECSYAESSYADCRGAHYACLLDLSLSEDSQA